MGGTRARADFEPASGAVRIALRTEGTYVRWNVTREYLPLQETGASDPAAWLTIPEDEARAIYEALGKYFGGSQDLQTLRSDYLAERARVDAVLTFLTRTRGRS